MAATWQKIWREAVSANSLLIRNREAGERKFQELLEVHSEDGMVYYEWAEAYFAVKDREAALEKFRQAKERLPLAHWKEAAQYGIEKTTGALSKVYEIRITGISGIQPYLYSANESELKFLLLNSISRIKTEQVTATILFRLALETFIEIIAEKEHFSRFSDLVDNINFICAKLSLDPQLKTAMHNIRCAGNAKVHPRHKKKDEELARDFRGRILDFLTILKFYRSESAWPRPRERKRFQ